MAKSIGTIPGVAGLGTTALQAGIALYKAIKSYQSHQQNVIDLLNETGDLNNALGSLNRTIASRKDLDLSALEFPLQRCEKACQEFKEAIEKISSLSGGNRASFRGWARLRCMGEDIDGFRRLLADYKSMINIALADATLQSSTLTAERIEGYTEMIQRAEANFEDRLQRIDGRLETLIKMTVAASGSEAEKAAAEVQQVQEERMNTEKYLQICTHLSEYIKNLLLDGRHSAASSTTSERDSVPERIASEGLEECAEAISRMANRLECYEMELFNRIVKAATSSSTSIGHEEEVKSLRDEWKSTREQMKILSKAERKLEEKVSVIQNRATGNAIQFMVSVNGRPIHGTNEGRGHWTNQVGGHMSNETLQQVMQGMVRMTLATCEDEKARRAEEKAKVKTTTMREEEEDGASSDGSKFEDLYGEGFTLDCESPTGSTLVNKRAR